MSKSHPAKKDEEVKNEIALQATTSTTVATVLTDDLAADAGAGLQNVTSTDLATPMLVILQSNNPQVKRSDGKYIPGAVEGMIYNNVAGAVSDGEQGLIVVPCFFEKTFVEWKANRGGFVASHGADTPLREQVRLVNNAEGKPVPTLPNGNNLIETNMHYVLVMHENGSFEPAVIPMASSQLKSSRVWNSLMSKVKLQKSDGTLFTPASFYTKYKLSTKARSKDAFSWYVWSMEPAGTTRTLDKSSTIYEAGKAFERAVSAGKVQVKHDDAVQPESSAALNEPGSTEDDGIPF